MQVFSAAVRSETKNMVELSVLAKESEQYQRCRKAVKDNTASDIFNNHFFEGIKVLNVTNVKHQVISKKLAVCYSVGNALCLLSNIATQSCVKRYGERGKVRGLFCCLSAEEIHSFCAYGLYRQKILTKFVGGKLAVYTPSWYTHPLPASTRDRQRRFQEAARDGVLFSSSAGVELSSQGRAAALAGEQRSRPPLHFSRKISLRNLTQIDEPNGDHLRAKEGADLPYLALCRVLLVSTYEVCGQITDADIAFAAAADYDSVHSSER